MKVVETRKLSDVPDVGTRDIDGMSVNQRDNWENHTEPGTKWIHSSNRKQDQSATGTPGGNLKPDPKDDQLAAAKQAFKQARKFLNAAVREAKKHKP